MTSGGISSQEAQSSSLSSYRANITLEEGQYFKPMGNASSTEQLSLTRSVWVNLALSAAANAVEQQVQSTWRATPLPGLVVEARLELPETKYNRINKAIIELSELNDDDPMYLDDSAKIHGLKMSDLFNTFRVRPPKIFAHGGDSIVFTWVNGNKTTYVTPLEGIGRLREFVLEKGSDPIHAVDFELSRVEEVIELLKYVGGSQWTEIKS